MKNGPDMKPIAGRLAEAVSNEMGSRPLRVVAAETGIGHATLSRVLRGKPVSFEVFVQLIQWTGVCSDWVLYGSTPRVERKEG